MKYAYFSSSFQLVPGLKYTEILISKQKLYNGSNIFLLVKGFGGGGNDKGNTQELLGMYPSDSFCLCMHVSTLSSLSLLHPSLFLSVSNVQVVSANVWVLTTGFSYQLLVISLC